MLAVNIVIMAVIVALILFVLLSILAAIRRPPAPQAEYRIDWDALADEELQSYLPRQKINAIKRYRELTGAGLKDSKETIDYIVANPDALEKAKHDPLKGAAARLSDTGGAGVRDLIAEGRLEEAVRVYADFMGVDEYTARDAVEQMRREGQT